MPELRETPDFPPHSPPQPAVLVVDDDRSIVHMISRALADSGIEVLPAASAAEGLEILKRRAAQIDACLLDIMLPDISGLEAFGELHRLDGRLPIIFITGDSSSDTAIEAMKKGAMDYVLKPLDLPRLRVLVNKAVEIRRKMLVPVELATEVPARESADSLLGNSPSMQDVYKAIGRVAPQDVTVLLCGESGTGKELVARAIYHHSLRADRPFLVVNCAAIPETLLESELLGHEKGTFTGADCRHIGKFEQCSGGTILLDEIGDMPLALQSKILRLLQSQQFERLGGKETIATDVRIIAATNRDLESMVADGRFREDLYYRLRSFVIRLPPLRDRGGDIALLVRHFLARYNREMGKRVERVSPEAMDALTSHCWPGNVRELENAVKQALLHTTGSILIPDFLPPLATPGRIEPASERPPERDSENLADFLRSRIESDSRSLYAETIEFVERRLIVEVLRKTRGNQSEAAKILGITRGSLRNKIRALGIEIDRVILAGGDNSG